MHVSQLIGIEERMKYVCCVFLGRKCHINNKLNEGTLMWIMVVVLVVVVIAVVLHKSYKICIYKMFSKYFHKPAFPWHSHLTTNKLQNLEV